MRAAPYTAMSVSVVIVTPTGKAMSTVENAKLQVATGSATMEPS